MLERIYDILQILEKSNGVSGKELADIFHVTTRTIRSDIKKFNENINESVANIAHDQLGYRLLIKDSQLYHEFLKNYLSNSSEGSKYRIKMILHLLLEEDKNIKIDQIAESMYVSRNVISRDIKKIRSDLSKYNLELKHDKSSGIYLVGNELNKRLCIRANKLYAIDKKNNDQNKIYQICKEVLSNNHYMLSERALNNLVLHIQICFQRNKIGHTIFLDNETLEKITMTPEYDIANKLVEILNVKYNYHLPLQETAYICLHICGKQMVRNVNAANHNLVIYQNMYDLSKQILENIEKHFNIRLSDDIDLLINLSYHLIPMIVRMKYKLWMKNPMLNEIKQYFSIAFLMAEEAAFLLNQKYDVHIPEDEIGYLALHINLSLKKQKDKKETSVLIICAGGIGTSELLKYQIVNSFGNRIKQADVYDLSQVNEDLANQYDYVFTTVPIQFSLNKPIIFINDILNKKDIYEIENLFEEETVKKCYKFFSRDLFLTHLIYSSKEEALIKICDIVSKHESLNSNDLYSSILEREKLADTALGGLVAIPHPQTPMGNKDCVCIAILDKPISWNQKKVQFIFMLLIAKKMDKDIYDFYDIVASLLSDPTIIKENILQQDFEFFKESLLRLKK